MFVSLLLTRFDGLKKSKAICPGIGPEKVAPGVKLFLTVPGPPGSKLKINVHFQHFTKKKKNFSLLVPNLVLVISERTVSWFR